MKVRNFPNPELKKLDSKNLQYAYKTSTISVLNSQLSLDDLKINQRSLKPNSAFLGSLSMESQPQNPEFRNNPENFHPCKYDKDQDLTYASRKNELLLEINLYESANEILVLIGLSRSKISSESVQMQIR